MDAYDLKNAVEAIRMPDGMTERLIEGCRTAAEEREATMKKTMNFGWKKAVALAAVAALLLCGAAAAGGRFKDVVRWDGAVTGTVYEQATEELCVEARMEQGELTVQVRFLAPDDMPYAELDTLRLGEYQVVDAAGEVVAQGEGCDPAVIADGTAELRLPLAELPGGSYRLQVSGFVGEKKADQPLPILGAWECGF